MDLHLPNHTHPFSQTEIDFAVELRPRNIVLMVYGKGVVPEAFDQHMEIVQRTGAQMILRPYEPAIISSWSPDLWAYECAERLRRYTGMQPIVVLDNEPNHRDDGGVTNAQKIHDFWVDSAVEFQRLIPIYHRPIIAMPPLSPIGNYRDIYRRLKNLGTHRWFKTAAIHVYARTMNWDEDRFVKNILGLDTYVTEFDTWTPNGYINLQEALSWLPLAKAVCWFIVNSDDPQFDFCNLMAHEEEIMSLTTRVELLEKQQAMTTEILKLIVEGRWTGELPNAEALLKALNPNDVNWTPAQLPKG